MSKGKKLTKEEFIRRVGVIHGDKYDYSKVTYINANTKVCIICKKHNRLFNQKPSAHLKGQRCPLCFFDSKRLTTNEFIKRSRKIHKKSKYDYSVTEYINARTKVKIKCPKHSIFEQAANSHLQGAGCPLCYLESHRLSKSEFVKIAKKVHGCAYSYDKVKYITNKKEVIILCKKHKIEFSMVPSYHLAGGKCPECTGINTEIFIEKSKEVHGKKAYDYSKVKYINSKTKVKIKCNKEGHPVFWQIPFVHLEGSGCPVCNESHGELRIRNWLLENKIKYKTQYSYSNLRGNKSNRLLRFDFYISFMNLLIEFDGEQHSKFVRFVGMSLEEAIKAFKQTQINDALKNKYCFDHNIPLLRISYKDIKRIPEILSENVFKLKLAA